LLELYANLGRKSYECILGVRRTRLEILKVQIAADVGDVQSERCIETANC